MRRFEVWADCNHRERETVKLVFADDVTEEEIEAACADALDTLIGNMFDTGWGEIE